MNVSLIVHDINRDVSTIQFYLKCIEESKYPDHLDTITCVAKIKDRLKSILEIGDLIWEQSKK